MKRKMRAPFVTIAVAVWGCGGQVVESNATDGGTATSCPESAPSVKGACSGDLHCGYSDGYCPWTYECREGAWASTSPPCNPPAPTCPTERPTDGTACPGETLSCSYPDTCGSGTRTVVCRAGLWADAPLVGAKCPLSVPTNGEDCSSCVGRYAEPCQYPEPPCGDISRSTLAICQTTGKWIVSISTCNPPAPSDAGF